MDQHGPTWSQNETKREPKAIKMGPKVLALVFYVERVPQNDQQKQKTMFRKVGTRTPLGRRRGIFEQMKVPKGQILGAFWDAETDKSDRKKKTEIYT